MGALLCLGLAACNESEEVREPCGDAVCDLGQACVQGVCVARCGDDMSALGPALSDDLTVVGSYCRDASTFGTWVSGGTFTVFDVAVRPSESGSELVLSYWEPDGFGTPTVTEVGAHAVAHDGDTLLFAGGYLDVSPNGSTATFGYTLSSDDSPGEVIRMARNGETVSVDAPGNFDASWWDDATVLVNGLGLGGDAGAGVYASVADGASLSETPFGVWPAGSYSGSVFASEDYVVAGATLPDFSNVVYVAARRDLEGVLSGDREAFDFETEGARVGSTGALPSAFGVVQDAVVVVSYDESFTLSGMTAYPITDYSVGSGLIIGAPEELSTGAVFDRAFPAGDGRMLLHFEGGLLLVE